MINENTSNSTQDHNDKVCGLCKENQSKYCCPRCEVLYCSLDCYKSAVHTECSEGFYKDCVNEELASYHADDESKHKMIEILKKMQNADVDEPEGIDELEENDGIVEVDSDDNEEIDLHDRIKDLDLNDADALWNILTNDERNEFEALLNQGDLECIVPLWDPWWLYRKEKMLVEDVGNIDSDELKQCPDLKEVVKLNSLTTVPSSPAIKFNITNVLASYAFIMRYFNGKVDPVEGATYLLNICANLDNNTNFDDLATAVESVAQKCLQSDLIETDEISLDVMKRDTFLLLQGPSEDNRQHYCKAAFSHLHRLFSDAKLAKGSASYKKKSAEKSEFSMKFPDHGSQHFPKLDVSKVKRCLKKVEYYLSYVDSCSMDFE